MISAISTTSKYILQPGLVSMHQQSLAWQSATELWKTELSFFQKLLDSYAPAFTNTDDKKRIDHFQNLIIYYKGEVIVDLKKKLRDHEASLAEMLKTENESDVKYFHEHKGLMEAAESFENVFIEFKSDFYQFIERVLPR